MVRIIQCPAVFLALATLSGLAAPVGVHAAQMPPPSEQADQLDPESPLAPMEGLGVDWPDMAKEAVVDDPIDAATPSVVQTADDEGERSYSVAVEGLAQDDATRVIPRFNEQSVLVAGQEKSANAAQVLRRAREDTVLLDLILRAEGYYDAVIDSRVENADGGKLRVTFAVTPGPVYRFSEVEVKGLETAGEKTQALRDAFPIDVRDPVNAEDVLAAEATLKTIIGRTGFPFAKVGEPEVVIDHDTRSATLLLNVDPGAVQSFNAIQVKGNRPPFGAAHVARIARFKPGQPYDQQRIDDLRRALVATSLVSGVQIEPVAAAEPGKVDLMVNMDRAPPRTVAGEVGYGTGEGFRAEASWTHRNLVKPEGAVTARGVLGTREQLASVALRMSNFGKRDHVLFGRVGYSNINRDAFLARTFEVAGGIERQTNIIWQKRWLWSAGFELLGSEERDVVVGSTSRKTFLIGALPLTLNYDGSDDLLDPKTGFRLGARFSPEFSRQSGNSIYARAQIDGSAYVPVGERVVMAGRVRLGTILGENLTNIAPSRRFYSGGGGSVRGYGYQLIGPRDFANDPVGGRSLTELAIEARIRLKAFGGNFAVVPFLDAGNVTERGFPRLSNFRFGAGVGLRYHSSFGPIRIDVGTPINPQLGDNPVTLFVSLGQAF